MADSQINVILAGIKDLTNQQVIKLALDINTRLKQTTPVLTGWARANWIPTIGSPSDADGIKPKDNDVAGAEQESSTGAAQLLSYTIDSGPVYISNNVPYIQQLNEGSSTKAPSGFVEAAIEQSVAAFQGK